MEHPYFSLLVVCLWLILWYMSAVIITDTYLRNRGFSLRVTSSLIIPSILFMTYFRMLFQERRKGLVLKLILLYFINYKLSVIYLTELLKECVRLYKKYGYSDYITESYEKDSRYTVDLWSLSKCIRLKDIKEIMK